MPRTSRICGRSRMIPAAVKSELAVARGLVFLAFSDLAPDLAPFALPHVGLFGGGLHAAHDERHVFRGQASHFKISALRRARFAVKEVSAPADDTPLQGALAGPHEPIDDLLDATPRRPQRRSPRRPRVLVRTGFQLEPLPDEFVEPKRWTRIIRGARRDPGKIHALEARARAAFTGLRKATAEVVTSRGRILSSVGDNLSSIPAYENGRQGSGRRSSRTVPSCGGT